MWYLMLVLTISISIGCGNNQIVKTANVYLDHIENGEFESAYDLLSPRLRDVMDFDAFRNFMIDPVDKTSVEEMGIDFLADSYAIYEDNISGCVYGALSMDEISQNFRLPIRIDQGKWWIDGVVVEQETPEMPGFYVSTRLRNISEEFFDWILNAEVEKLWDHTSNRIRSEMTKTEYKEYTISTTSGETPSNEGYSIMIGPAYTTEPKNINGQMKREGFVIATVVLGEVESPEKEAKVVAPFIHEDGEWRCDFARLEESDLSELIQKD